MTGRFPSERVGTTENVSIRWRHHVKRSNNKRNRNSLLLSISSIQGRNTDQSDSKFVPSQWETALLGKEVSHWLGVSLETALYISAYNQRPFSGRSAMHRPCHRKRYVFDFRCVPGSRSHIAIANTHLCRLLPSPSLVVEELPLGVWDVSSNYLVSVALRLTDLNMDEGILTCIEFWEIAKHSGLTWPVVISTFFRGVQGECERV